MKRVFLASVSAMALCATAASTNALSQAKGKIPPPRSKIEELNRHGYKRSGGGVEKPGSAQGQIVFVNTQTRVPESEFQKVVDEIFKLSEFRMRFVQGRSGMTGEEAKAAFGADVVIIIADDEKIPTSLIAAEDRWAVMNVAKLAKGYRGKEVKGPFLATRARKQFIRMFCSLCGGGASQFRGNVLSAPDVDSLDSVDEFIPMDLKYKLINYLRSIGVVAPRVVTYREACEEGWAPNPTNDVQRKVWNEVHQLPTNPLPLTKPAK